MNQPIQFRHNNIAILTGKNSNLFVIDIDVGENGLKYFQQLCSKYNYAYQNETTAILTPSGGVHLYYKYNDKFSGNSVKMRCGDQPISIDIRSNGGCVIAPPSKYKKKNGEIGKYQFLCMKTPQICPEFLIETLS
jgi:hypothetical protein